MIPNYTKFRVAFTKGKEDLYPGEAGEAGEGNDVERYDTRVIIFNFDGNGRGGDFFFCVMTC